jgi:hypothetical protein
MIKKHGFWDVYVASAFLEGVCPHLQRRAVHQDIPKQKTTKLSHALAWRSPSILNLGTRYLAASTLTRRNVITILTTHN